MQGIDRSKLLFNSDLYMSLIALLKSSKLEKFFFRHSVNCSVPKLDDAIKIGRLKGTGSTEWRFQCSQLT